MPADAHALHVFTIYDHPLDYPNHFVVRHWSIAGGVIFKHECKLADTLAEAVSMVPVGLVRFPRDPTDPAAIVESWI